MFQKWLNALQEDSNEKEPDQYWVERLTALLLVEIARSDTKIDAVEIAAIERAIKSSCVSIGTGEIEELIATAKQEAESTVSFHEHIRQINKGFNRRQKLLLIEQMWRVAYADDDLDKYEEYTIRKLSDLLHIEHAEFIKAKLRVTGI